MTVAALSTAELRQRLVNLYNTYRNAAFNRRYYGARLHRFRQYAFWMDMVVALSTSSAIGSWAVWRKEGQVAWVTISALSAVLAAVRPVLKLPSKIELYSKLYRGHADSCYDLERIVEEVSASRTLTAGAMKRYERIKDRQQKLAADDEPRPSAALVRACFNETNAQIPADGLWLPYDTEEQ